MAHVQVKGSPGKAVLSLTYFFQHKIVLVESWDGGGCIIPKSHITQGFSTLLLPYHSELLARLGQTTFRLGLI